MSVNVPEKMYKTTPWWVILIEGILALIVGLALLSNSAGTVEFLVQVMGLFWLVGGIMAIVSIFVVDTEVHWAWSLLSGVLGIIAGIVVLRHPLWSSIIATTTLVIGMGIYGLVKGGIDLYKGFKGAGSSSVLMGIVSVLFGIILLTSSVLTTVQIASLFLGVAGAFGGIVMIVYAIKTRKG